MFDNEQEGIGYISYWGDDVHRNVQAEIAHVLEESALMSFLRVRGVRLSEMNR